jgi:hypothetical protein
LFGQVAGPPGFDPPDCWRFGLFRRRLESTPGILATNGNAVTVSAARATAIKEYFILKGMFLVEYKSSQSFCVEKVIAGTKEIFQLYISSVLILSSPRKEVPDHGSFSMTP